MLECSRPRWIRQGGIELQLRKPVGLNCGGLEFDRGLQPQDGVQVLVRRRVLPAVTAAGALVRAAQLTDASRRAVEMTKRFMLDPFSITRAT